MTWHPTEDELVLHFYGESTADDRARVDAHVQECSSCAASWQELSHTLALVSQADVPDPGVGFDRAMWARVSRELPARAPARFPRPFVLVGALAAVLVAAITASYTWTQLQRGAPVAEVAEAISSPSAPSDRRERVLLTALNDHFSKTEMLFVELLNAPDVEPVALDFERMTADDLVASGRLYRETATQNGETRFVQILDDLEGVLVEVARSPEHVDREDVAFLRTRIDDNGLLFKVRAVTAEVRGRQQTLMTAQ